MKLADILPQLNGVKKTGSGYLAFCPAHQDVSNRSLSLTERDGVVLIHCFCGCSFGQILNSLDITFNPLVPELEAVYDYTDAQGNVLYQALRYYPKTFKQRRIENDEYVWNLAGVERVLFQLPKVLEALEGDEVIYLVEGEKDCINPGIYGITATTCSGGASAEWLPQYTETLHNAKIGIIPDNDKPGRSHAENMAKFLYGWAKSLKLLELGASDVSDWLLTHNAEELAPLWENAKEYIPIGAVTREEHNQLKGHLIYIHDRYTSKKKKRNHKDIYMFNSIKSEEPDEKPTPEGGKVETKKPATFPQQNATRNIGNESNGGNQVG